VVLTVPLLEGLDGVKKMSKSTGNYIALEDSPSEMFGKIMSISDDLMWRYFELLSFRSIDDIAALQKRVGEGMNPRDAKFELAEEIIARFHSQAGPQRAGAGLPREGAENVSVDLWQMCPRIHPGQSAGTDRTPSQPRSRRQSRGRQ
jgi:tyrosyl-tRNA synthetase